MKLGRFGIRGKERPCIVLDDNRRKDISSLVGDLNHDFFQSGGIERLKNELTDPEKYPDVDSMERWGACIARPGKVICIGLNYSDHAAESGMPVPPEPIIFQKAANTVIGPYDDVTIPRLGKKTDWEVELGVIIGRNATYLNSEQESSDYIAGYCVANDVSERAFQLERGGQWTKGKSCDNFNPTGPYLLTADEVDNVQDLSMELKVNGAVMQRGNTSFMVFGVNFLVHYLSQFMTLEAGDLILTGTPPGVGMGQKPARYLNAGDTMELTIQGLGTQKQTCVQA